MARSEQDAWVRQVLGIELPGAGTDIAALRQRLARLGPTLVQLRGLDPAAFAVHAGTLRSLTAALAAPDALARIAALEDAVAKALSTGRAGEAQGAARRSIDAAKLLLRWRAAQAQVAQALTSIGDSILAREDVQRDPRLGQVRQAVVELPGLVPQFGGALEALLDQAMNAGTDAGIAPAALVEIGKYRKSLAGATQLLALDALAARELGAGGLIGTLDGTLRELEQELQVAA